MFSFFLYASLARQTLAELSANASDYQRYPIDIFNFGFNFCIIQNENIIYPQELISIDCFNNIDQELTTIFEVQIRDSSLIIITKNSQQDGNNLFQNIIQFNECNNIELNGSQSLLSLSLQTIQNKLNQTLWSSKLEVKIYTQCYIRLRSDIPAYNEFNTTYLHNYKESQCQPGCLMCDQIHSDNQCDACEENKIFIDQRNVCECLNSYLKAYDYCLTYTQALTQNYINFLISDQELSIVIKFEIKIRGNTYDFNGFQFSTCEELLTQEVLKQLLKAEIYQILLIIRYEEYILSLECSGLAIGVYIQFIKQDLSLTTINNYKSVQLTALSIQIDFNNNPPPNQILLVNSKVLSLTNLYFDQNNSSFELKVIVTSGISLQLYNITFFNIKLTSINFITIHNEHQSIVDINSMYIKQCNFDYFNLLFGQTTNNGHIVQIINLRIDQSFLNNFDLFTFIAQYLFIVNLTINDTFIQNSYFISHFVVIRAVNISTMYSTIKDSTFIYPQPIVESSKVIIFNFLIFDTILEGSRIIMYYSRLKSQGELIFHDLKLNSLIIKEQMEQFYIFGAYKVDFNHCRIANIDMYATQLIILNFCNSLYLQNLRINNITFSTNHETYSLMLFIDFSILSFKNIQIQNIQSNNYIIHIQSSQVAYFKIQHLQMGNLDSDQYLRIDCANSLIQLETIILLQKKGSYHWNSLQIVNLKSQNISIKNSIIKIMTTVLIIQAEYLSITDSQLESSPYLCELYTNSKHIYLSNNKFYNIFMNISAFSGKNKLGSYLNFTNNHFLILINESIYLPQVIWIEDRNVLIADNKFQIQIVAYVFTIKANNHQISFVNNSFQYQSNYFILEAQFTIKTKIAINKTYISNIYLSDPNIQPNCSIFEIKQANEVIIHDLLIVYQQQSVFLFLGASKIRLSTIQIINSQMNDFCIQIIDFRILRLDGLIFKNTQVLRSLDKAHFIESLIAIQSKHPQLEINISRVIIQQVTSNQLISIIIEFNANMYIEKIQFIKNRCSSACLFILNQYEQIYFRLSRFVSKQNMAPLIMRFDFQNNNNILLDDILMEDITNVISIVTQQLSPISNYEIYESFMIQGQLRFYIQMKFQTNQISTQNIPRIVVSFNNGKTFQKSIAQPNTRMAFVQFEGRTESQIQFLYIPPYGYSLNNYSRLNKEEFIYKQYKLELKFSVNYYDQTLTDKECSFQINGSQNTLIDFDINYYEPNLIEFNMTCQIEDPISLIFYAKQFQCQIGEINMTNQCIPCARDQYSLSKIDQLCKDRDPFSMQYVEMSLIQVREGFWRSEFYTDKIEPCLIWLDSCKGGYQFGDRSCKEGYIGSTCFECDFQRQFYRQIDGSCGDRQYSNILFCFLWILLSLLLLNINVKINLQYLQDRKHFVLIYAKFSQICQNERINIIQALLILLAEYQLLSSLFSDRYTNENSLVNNFIMLSSYTDFIPFQTLDHLLSKFFNQINWSYYRLLLYIALSCIICIISIMQYLIKLQNNGKPYQFQKILLICYYTIQMNIFIYLKQLIGLITPISLSNDFFVYNQLDLSFTEQIDQVGPFLLVNMIIMTTIIFVTSILFKKMKLDLWNKNQRIININALITLLSVITLSQNYIFRLFLIIIQVEFFVKLIQKKKIFHNQLVLQYKIYILRILAFQIIINSLIIMAKHETTIMILSQTKSLLWIGMNLQILFAISRSYMFKKMSPERQHQLFQRLKQIRKRPD